MQSAGLSRRDALKVSFLGAAALALPWQRVLSAGEASLIDPSRIPRPYTMPFKQPPVLQPVRRDTTTDYYRIEQRQFTGQILPGVSTTLFGYNGLAPGPVIKVRKNRRLVMRQVNNLPATHPTLGYVPWTSTHLHGSPSLPQYDGYASDITQPGQYKDYVFPNNASARTLWYHDHGMHHTAENAYMGLAGQYHITDPAEDLLNLPRGRYDVPLSICDAMFAQDGSMLFDDDNHNSLFGDVVLVNGVPWPNMRVEQRKYRFRILNTAISRGFLLKLSNGMPFKVIATDAGLVPSPISVTQLRVGMAERYEVVIDFAAFPVGQKIQLVNAGVPNTKDYTNTFKVMQFEVAGPATDTRFNQLPSQLLSKPHPVMQLTAAQAIKTRSMRLKHDDVTNEWTIDDVTWKQIVDSGYSTVFANPKPGDVEIWTIDNHSGGWFHPLHIHFVDFKILSRNGRPPRPEENGPKDVVYMGEGETVRLLMKFSYPGGPEGRYMIHCHNLTHEDHDMMTQFQIGKHDATCDPMTAAMPRNLPETPL